MLIYLFATFLLANPLLADTIGNVEYSLPPTKKEWKLAAEKQSDKSVISTTRHYVPENRGSVAIAEEAFSANINNLPGDPKEDEASIRERIQKMFPEMKVDVRVVAQDPKSVLYSWSVSSDSSKVSFFGITKHFHVNNGTVNLMYKTTNKEIYDADKEAWIEALKAAHLQ